MGKLLYIQASPRAERSHCRHVADAFAKAYTATHPGDEVITRDVFRLDLPAFDGVAVKAKYDIMHGNGVQADERRAWGAVEAVIDEFVSADKYVFAVPMWNFGLPYRLKQYLDLLIQPGYTFRVTNEGDYVGLVTGKPVLTVYARGGSYSAGSGLEGMDFQKPYLELALGFIGFTSIQSLVIEPTLHGGTDVATAMCAKAAAEATELAGQF